MREEEEEQEVAIGKTKLLDQVIDSSNNFTDDSISTTRKIKSFYSSLDPFVTVTSTKPTTEQIIMPQQREVNLQDPLLMNKGILSSEKKKNLTNV
jgi:hypothetical protein